MVSAEVLVVLNNKLFLLQPQQIGCQQPSPFVHSLQRVDGCICINPGHLTKKAGGGTFAKISIPDQLPGTKPDLSLDIGVQIVYI